MCVCIYTYTHIHIHVYTPYTSSWRCRHNGMVKLAFARSQVHGVCFCHSSDQRGSTIPTANSFACLFLLNKFVIHVSAATLKISHILFFCLMLPRVTFLHVNDEKNLSVRFNNRYYFPLFDLRNCYQEYQLMNLDKIAASLHLNLNKLSNSSMD